MGCEVTKDGATAEDPVTVGRCTFPDVDSLRSCLSDPAGYADKGAICTDTRRLDACETKCQDGTECIGGECWPTDLLDMASSASALCKALPGFIITPVVDESPPTWRPREALARLAGAKMAKQRDLEELECEQVICESEKECSTSLRAAALARDLSLIHI